MGMILFICSDLLWIRQKGTRGHVILQGIGAVYVCR